MLRIIQKDVLAWRNLQNDPTILFGIFLNTANAVFGFVDLNKIWYFLPFFFLDQMDFLIILLLHLLIKQFQCLKTLILTLMELLSPLFFDDRLVTTCSEETISLFLVYFDVELFNFLNQVFKSPFDGELLNIVDFSNVLL